MACSSLSCSRPILSRLLGLLLLPLALPLGAADCVGVTTEGEGEGEGEEGEGEPGEPSAQELADALVRFLDECGVAGGSDPLELVEPALFDNNIDIDIDEVREGLEQSFADPDVTVNEAAYAACLAELGDCDNVFDGASSCSLIFEGNRPAGAGCGSENQCEPELQCPQADAVGGGLECGTCLASPGVGDSCDADPNELLELDCGDAAACAETGAGVFTCVARDQPLGASCSDVDLCAPGSVCDFGSELCVLEDDDDGFEVGDACVESCDGPFSGLACVDATCVLVTPVQPGGACDALFFTEVVNYCVNQLAGVNTCFDDDDDGVGVCTALPSTGPCVGGRCARDAACNDVDVCVALPGADQPCVDFECADELVCDDSVDPAICRALPGLNEACIDGECDEDLECNDVDVCVADEPLVCPA